MNQGIYGLGGQLVTPVQGPFAGVADARKILSLQVLLCGGGGGGGVGSSNARPGPGGGGGGVLEATIGVLLQASYTVSVGAGAAASAVGNPTQFGQMVAIGGGQTSNSGGTVPLSGATGGGSIQLTPRWASLAPSQGFGGGLAATGAQATGGGGGAGALGGDAISGASGSGGIGRASSITGTLVYYGGGGGAGSYVGVSAAGAGGLTGGGAGSSAVASAASSGASNTGGGGGGSAANGSASSGGGAGGSGVVILRWNASQAVATLSAGLTFTRTTVGTDTILIITGGTGTVTWG